MEKKYIDAETICEEITRTIASCETREALYSECAETRRDAAASVKTLQGVKSFIEALPAADAQEVRHGKWVYHYRLKKFVCLECGFEARHKPEFKFCPNCGAKMDGGKNDTKTSD